MLVREAAERNVRRWGAGASRAAFAAVGGAAGNGGWASGVRDGAVEAGEGGEGGVHVVLGGVALHHGVGFAFGEADGVLDAGAAEGGGLGGFGGRFDGGRGDGGHGC